MAGYQRKQLFYILILFHDGSHDLFLTYGVDYRSVLDNFLDNSSLNLSSVKSIIVSPPNFI